MKITRSAFWKLWKNCWWNNISYNVSSCCRGVAVEEAIITNFSHQNISKESKDEFDISAFTFNVLKNRITQSESKSSHKHAMIEHLTNQLIISKSNIDTNSKLDTTFPDGQFKIPGYISNFHRDLNQYRGGLMVDMVVFRGDIPSKMLSSEASSIDVIYIELNFRKKKWRLHCTYNPNRSNISNYLDVLRRSLITKVLFLSETQIRKQTKGAWNFSGKPRSFYLTGDITNLYPFTQSSLE